MLNQVQHDKHGHQHVRDKLSDCRCKNLKSEMGWMNYFIVMFATGFGVGYSPIAPGTLGTLLAIPVYYFLSNISSPIYEITLIGFFFLSVWISENAEVSFGKRDDRRIVIDEMMGFLITMLWVPKTALFIIIGFLLFRVFDIIKPPPIRRLERAKGGFGVVLDDVLAGVYANIILQIISYYFPLSLG